MDSFSFNTARFLRFEFEGTKRLGELCRQNLDVGDRQCGILLVTDRGVVELGLADAAIESLEAEGFSVSVFDCVVADPPENVILDATQIAREKDVGLVVGFGGGSSMDVAKVVALLVASGQEISETYGINLANGPRLPLVLVPTTAGTGSEVTAVSVVTTGETVKKGVISPHLLPDLAVLDPSLTLGLPPHITAATGVDAMVHAIEAFTSRNPNNNPVSRTLAEQALRLLGANIRTAVSDGNDVAARSAMLLGAMLAGQAFANSPVAAVHGLAYPIGGIFHVPHGLSNSLVLPHVMRFNAEVCADAYTHLAPLVFSDFQSGGSVRATCDTFVERVAQLTEDLGLESRLTQVGIAESDLANLAGEAMKQSRLLGNNPREVTYDAAYEIYAKAL